MSKCPVSGDSNPSGLARFLRRPDTAFWFELFRAAPAQTGVDRRRRERIARYALGMATLLSFLYASATLLIDTDRLLPMVGITASTGALFALGMWMASLGQAGRGRELLMLALTAQVFLLLWFSGSELLIVVFAPVIAALARILYTRDELWRRRTYILIGAVLFVVFLLAPPTSRVDFSSVPPWLMTFTRGINACVALAAVLLLLGTYEHEVLRNENELVHERERSDRLLRAVLPESIAARLRDEPGMIAHRHPEVTVLFADIAGFTPWSALQPPETVVALLERIFSRFDQLVLACDAEKIKTIGDAYMVIAGAPRQRADHAAVVARLALGMMAAVQALREETRVPFDLRVGIHSGPVIAGVIGVTRFSYDVWGDTVNTASRMESHGVPGCIQISEAVRRSLDDDFVVEPRGQVDIKGKGRMQTWWLKSVRERD